MIRDLIDNYIRQEKIYQKVAVSSLDQTILLQKETIDTVQLKELLRQRQLLMDEVAATNEAARKLQEQMKEVYGLKAFTLSEIQDIIGTVDFEDLKQILKQMGEVLKSISQSDLKNQALMRQAAAEAAGQPTVSPQQASSAYRQSMDHKKT